MIIKLKNSNKTIQNFAVSEKLSLKNVRNLQEVVEEFEKTSGRKDSDEEKDVNENNNEEGKIEAESIQEWALVYVDDEGNAYIGKYKYKRGRN